MHYVVRALTAEDEPIVGELYERMGFIKVAGSEIVNRTRGVSFNMVCGFEER